MNSALIGVIGVAAGALATGGVQALLAWRERRVEAVASARLLWAELRADVLRLQGMLQHGEWRKKPTRLERLDELWDAEKRNISRATTNSEFQTLAAAVHHVGVVEAWHEREAVFDDARPLVEIATKHSIEARVTAFIAGEHLLPRLLHRKRFSEARREGALYEPDVPSGQTGVPESVDTPRI